MIKITEIRCPLKDCEWNRFKGVCTKKVVTLKSNEPHHNSLRCYDFKEK